MKAADIGEIQDTYRMRALLEPEAAVLASQRATADELDKLAELSDTTVSTEAGAAAMNEANRLFHVRIAELARVPMLIQTINALHEEIERFLNLQGALGRPYTASNHRRLVDNIRTGSADEIRAVVLSGIEKAREHMIETLLGGARAAGDTGQ